MQTENGVCSWCGVRDFWHVSWCLKLWPNEPGYWFAGYLAGKRRHPETFGMKPGDPMMGPGGIEFIRRESDGPHPSAFGSGVWAATIDGA